MPGAFSNHVVKPANLPVTGFYATESRRTGGHSGFNNGSTNAAVVYRPAAVLA